MFKLLTRFSMIASLVAILSLFAGCSVIEGIFKAGVWVGVLIVVAVIALIVWFVMKAKK